MSNLNALSQITTTSTLSDGQQIIEAMKSYVDSVVTRAFSEYPLNNDTCTLWRWRMIEAAMYKAQASIQAFVTLGVPDSWNAEDEKVNVRGANADWDQDGAFKAVGLYFAIYEQALQREISHAG